MTGVSHLGPWPGDRLLEAQTTVLGELTAVPEGVRGLPSMVQLPARGPAADSTARTLAALVEMPVEIGPHGWKLADRPGGDLARARAVLREQVDTLAVAAHGWTGPLVVGLRGPWTIAATVDVARGDRVLGDPGAVRELTASLAEGVTELLGAVSRGVPGAQPVLVLREPLLPDVLGGTVPTFSGQGRFAPVPVELAASALEQVVAAARAAGAQEVVGHGGTRVASRALRALELSTADAVGVPAGGLGGPQWEQLAAVVESGRRLWFGLPRERGGRRPSGTSAADVVARPWRAVGLPAEGLADVVVHADGATASGADLVRDDLSAARAALTTAVQVARDLADRAAG